MSEGDNKEQVDWDERKAYEIIVTRSGKEERRVFAHGTLGEVCRVAAGMVLGYMGEGDGENSGKGDLSRCLADIILWLCSKNCYAYADMEFRVREPDFVHSHREVRSIHNDERMYVIGDLNTKTFAKWDGRRYQTADSILSADVFEDVRTAETCLYNFAPLREWAESVRNLDDRTRIIGVVVCTNCLKMEYTCMTEEKVVK